MLLVCSIPAAQVAPKVNPCNNSNGSTHQDDSKKEYPMALGVLPVESIIIETKKSKKNTE